MGMFDHFPYTNFHELNLDWILQALKEIEKTMDQFVAINSLKYADPIQWSIIRQYEKNTIVIDPLTGTAYISVQAVPSGVAITNTDYWTVVFDLGLFVVRASKNFTLRWEEATTLTATMPVNEGQWVVWGDTLYRALSNIIAGDQYVIGSNIERITIEQIKDEIYQTFNNIIGSLEDLNTEDKSNLVAAINEVLTKLVDTTGSLEDLDTTDKSNIVAAINEVLTKLVDTAGSLEDLDTENKSNLVSAVNEVNTIAIRNNRFYRLSDLEEPTIFNIQDIINNYDIIDFDIDVNLGSASLNIGSNKEIYSSNNSVISGDGRIFNIVGQKSEVYDAAITFTDRNNGSFLGSLEDSREYMIVSDMNCIGSDAYDNLGYPNYMGGGTESLQECYPVIYSNVNINGNAIYTNIPTYAAFNTGKAYKFNPVTNVYIHDINVDSSHNISASSANYVPILLRYSSNCRLKNIKIIVGYGNCITIASSHGVVVEDCSASVLDHNFIDHYHYHNNVYRLCGCYNVILQNCSGTGSQPFDITYRGNDPYVSAYCEVLNCTSYANYTCLTTHPGTWNCVIDGLTGYTFGTNGADGISVRGSLHIIRNCVVYGSSEAGTYGMGSVEGCLTHQFYNNIIQGFDYGYYIHEASNRPFSSRGTPNISFTNNIVRNTRSFLHINKANNLANFSPYATLKNNTLQGNDPVFNTDRAIITLTGEGTGNVQFFDISLNILNTSIDYAINNVGSATLRRVMIDITAPYSASLDNSATGNFNNCALSIKGGQVAAITTNGTQIPPMTEYNTI